MSPPKQAEQYEEDIREAYAAPPGGDAGSSVATITKSDRGRGSGCKSNIDGKYKQVKSKAIIKTIHESVAADYSAAHSRFNLAASKNSEVLSESRSLGFFLHKYKKKKPPTCLAVPGSGGCSGVPARGAMKSEGSGRSRSSASKQTQGDNSKTKTNSS